MARLYTRDDFSTHRIFCIVLCALIIAVRRCVSDIQSREGELQCGAVTIDLLCGDVQENEVVALVQVFQRTVRHQEKVQVSQAECVHSRGGNCGADLVQRNCSSSATCIATALTVNVNIFAMIQYATRTTFGIMPQIRYEDVFTNCFLVSHHRNHPVVPILFRNSFMTA